MQGVRWALAALLSRAGYDCYLRFVLPFFGIALAISLLFVALGAVLG